MVFQVRDVCVTILSAFDGVLRLSLEQLCLVYILPRGSVVNVHCSKPYCEVNGLIQLPLLMILYSYQLIMWKFIIIQCIVNCHMVTLVLQSSYNLVVFIICSKLASSVFFIELLITVILILVNTVLFTDLTSLC